jgi:uncharacterized DUF497 family protein
MQVAGFDWDESNRSKCQKHGFSQAGIEHMFGAEVSVLPDPLHSKSEERFKAIGKGTDGRWIFVVFTLRTRRGKTVIRPISARHMHRKEVEHYEKEIARVQK